VFQSNEIKNKIKKTNLRKYGSLHISNSAVLQEQKTLKHIKNKINSLESFVKPLFEIEEYKDSNIKNRYKWECSICSYIFDDHLDFGHIPICRKCTPKLKGFSRLEKEIVSFLNESDIVVIENDRKILQGKEIDIFVSDYNLAIEFNGVYWHSENQGKHETYHLEKTIGCEQKGIQLLHVLDYEWIEKQEIIKSIIMSKLNNYKNVIRIINCKIKEIDVEQKSFFLNNYHFQGDDESSIYLGLFHEETLVQIMTFNRLQNSEEYKLCSLVTTTFTQIIGGADKLWRYFLKKYNPTSVSTYVNKRLFNGLQYKKLGFELSHDTKPNFQMLDEGANKIWDCGDYIYTYSI